MSYIKMKAPDGDTGDVRLHNISEALRGGYQPVSETGRIRMKAPDGEIGEARIDMLQETLDGGFTIVESDYKDIPREAAAGVAQGLGGTVDFVDKAADYIGVGSKSISNVASGVSGAISSGLEGMKNFKEKNFPDAPKNEGLDNFHNAAIDGTRNFSDKAREYADSDDGLNLAHNLPESLGLNSNKARNKTVDVARTTGDFATMAIPAAGVSKGLDAATKGVRAVKSITTSGKVAKTPWLDKLNKFLEVKPDIKSLAKYAGVSAGSGAGLEVLKRGRRNDEDWATTTTGKIAQTTADIAYDMGSMMLGGLTVQGAGNYVLKKATQAITNPKSLVPFSFDAKKEKYISTMGNKVDEQLLKIAKDNDLPLRPDMLLQSKEASILVQNTLRSGFADKVYRDTFNKIPEKIYDNIEKTIFNDVSMYQASKEVIGDEATKLLNPNNTSNDR